MKLFGKEFNPQKRVEISHTHRKFIESLDCPQCSSKKLKVLTLEEGTKGWEAQVFCDNCKTKGIINNGGFRFEFVRKEGK